MSDDKSLVVCVLCNEPILSHTFVAVNIIDANLKTAELLGGPYCVECSNKLALRADSLVRLKAKEEIN